MSLQTTTFYLRSGQAPPTGLSAYPSAFLAAWDQTGTHYGSTSGGYLSPIQYGAAQATVSPTWSSVTNGTTKAMGHVQYVSDALTAQTISSGNWTFAFALTVSNASGSNIYQPKAAMYLVNGSTGAIRTTIFAIGTFGASRGSTSEETCYTASASGSSFTATAGDYLVFEAGMAASPSGGNWTPTSSLDDSGATTISSDNAATSDAKSFITSPSAITFTPNAALVATPTFYMRSDIVVTNSTNQTVPASFQASNWTNKSTSGYGTGVVGYLYPTPGTTQNDKTGVGFSSLGIASSANYAIWSYVSPSLLANQTIPAGDWTIGFAADFTNGGTGGSWQPWCAIYLANSNGGVSSMLFNAALPTGAATGRTATGEYAAWSATISLTSVTPTANQFLVVELGMYVTMGSVAHVPAMDIYDGGSTAISSDNASISSAQAFLTLPGNVCYVSPTSDDGGLIFQRAKWDVQPALQGMQIRDLQSRIANTPALVSKMPSPEDLVIVPDATSNSGYQSGVTSLSWSHTCGGSNRALAIGLHWFGSSSGFTVSNLNPTYNSVNPLGTWPASLTAENTVHALILLLLNPAAGTHTIAASWNETLDAVGTALSLVGCDQNSEAPNYGQGGNAGTSSGAGEVDGFSTILWATSFIVTAFATADSSVTLLSPQTQKQNVSGAKGTAALGYYSSSSPGDVKLGYTIGASKDWHTNSEEVPQVYSSLELEVMLMQSRICMSMP